MKGVKIALAGGLALFLALQLIRPAHNMGRPVPGTDLAERYAVSPRVAGILKTSCYDCHSSHTHYPWYADIQPVGWLLANHIREGKAELNFSEFGTYSERRQLSKLKAIKNSVAKGSMPLRSYTLLHREAVLSPESKALLVNWATKAADSLSAKRQGQ